MNAKPEIFAVIWVDRMVGPLSLHKPNASTAVESAKRIHERGVGKVTNVRAVHLAAGSMKLETLWGHK